MGNELLRIIESLELQKGLDKETLIKVIEESLSIASESEFSSYDNPFIKINSASGSIDVFIKKLVVSKVEDEKNEISLKDAKKEEKSIKIGDLLEEKILENHSLTRIAVEITKKTLNQKLNFLKKEKVFNKYKKKEGELLTGKVLGINQNNILIDFKDTEGFLSYSERIPGEKYQVGDIITVLIKKVEEKHTNVKSILYCSRKDPNFVKKLFEREIREIEEGIVKIVSIARIPGERTKVAVSSTDPNIDPKGSCIGPRGSRIKPIIRELNREKIDVVRLESDIEKYLKEAFYPVTLTSVDIDRDKKIIVVETKPEEQVIAIGKRGVNIRLINKLLGWEVNVNKVADIDMENIKKLFFEVPNFTEEVINKCIDNRIISFRSLLDFDFNELLYILALTEDQLTESLTFAKKKRA